MWNNACPGLNALPVNIIYFGGKLIGEIVKLNWTVENEKLFDRYEVERSFNGTYYTSIGLIKAVSAAKYSFTDNDTENRGRQVFYRLKKVDKDGQYSYSQALKMHIPLNTKFVVYPSPATTFIQVQLNGNASEKGVLQITDMMGKMVFQQTFNSSLGSVKVSTSKLVIGTYMIKLMCNNGEQYVQRFVIVR